MHLSQSFDPQAEYQRQLSHLVAMASTPGWKQYAWSRAKELDQDQSKLFAGIAADLVTAMAGQASSTASESPTPTKRS
jgi:hypothetical protein